MMTTKATAVRRRTGPTSLALAAALAVALGVIVDKKFGGVSAFPAQATARAAAPVFSPARERAAEKSAAAMVRYARQGHPGDPERLPGYDQANGMYRLAYRREQQGRHEEAAGDYAQAIRYAPGWGELYYQIGWCLKEEGRFTEAEAAERQAARLSVNDAWSYYSEGDMLLELHRYEQALPFYLTFVQIAPHDPNLFMGYRRLGGVYEMLGEFRRAARADRECVRLRPTDADAHDDLGYSDAMIGDQAGSARECRIVLRLRPDDVEATGNLGDALALLGDKAGARREWAKVLRLTSTGIFADDARQMLAKSR